MHLISQTMTELVGGQAQCGMSGNICINLFWMSLLTSKIYQYIFTPSKYEILQWNEPFIKVINQHPWENTFKLEVSWTYGTP